MKTIARDDYLQQLIGRKHNGLVKIVTGIRRCGKSYLLFTLFKQHLLDSGVPEDHIIEIALDDRANKGLHDPDVCYQYVKNSIKDNGQYSVMLDEVQNKLKRKDHCSTSEIRSEKLSSLAAMFASVMTKTASRRWASSNSYSTATV
ncbi:AAA family ATPase [Bifidobacterium longum]|uniref:AAA family ATPase n=1 Tax=Bifidobacterium longum TaxID=216816 RepID=UPI00374EBDF7